MMRCTLDVLLVQLLVVVVPGARGDWLVKNQSFVGKGELTQNSTTEYDKCIHYALQRTYRDNDGEAVDAMEHYFYGQSNGIALELGGLDGSFKTG